MKHIGLLCPPELGHLSSICSLGNLFQQRGYQVTLFGLLDAQEKMVASHLKSNNIDFCEIGFQIFPQGSFENLTTQLSKQSGMQALKLTISWSQKATAMMFQEAPKTIPDAGVDLLVVDQVTVAGGTIADYLGLPYATICSALPLDQESGIPPFFMSWGYRDNWLARLRNQLGYTLFNRLAHPIWQVILNQRRQWGLPLYQQWTDINSPLAQLCQLPQMLDFPRQRLSQKFYYVGTFRDFLLQKNASDIDKTFPFEKLNHKPLIYAGLGTLQNRLFDVFYTIAKACQHLAAQLVISLGGGADPSELPALPGFPIVVKYTPQEELLKRSVLTITHAGQNTVIESLTCGVPIVAIPITND